MGQLRSGIITSIHIPLTRAQSHVTSNYQGGREITIALSQKSWRTWTLVKVTNLGHTDFGFYRILGNSSDTTFLCSVLYSTVVY